MEVAKLVIITNEEIIVLFGLVFNITKNPKRIPRTVNTPA